ncbi:hypothetical protein WICPIJ_001083 [Wickerhamomyces pijperi]|uniref:Uncharacterized protein n=1 Tax=Wickerhamomyces pijperi TaxID=599730 RepID=A0A9P8QEE8_WICPI|nr:hypothetical protein WICPIJ_001083 [Wickerhamomyces pijperi]
MGPQFKEILVVQSEQFGIFQIFQLGNILQIRLEPFTFTQHDTRVSQFLKSTGSGSLNDPTELLDLILSVKFLEFIQSGTVGTGPTDID